MVSGFSHSHLTTPHHTPHHTTPLPCTLQTHHQTTTKNTMLARSHVARFAGVNFRRSWARTQSPRLFTTAGEDNEAMKVVVEEVAEESHHTTGGEEETINITTNVSEEAAAAAAPIVRRRAMAHPSVSPSDAVETVVESARAKFDETVELSLGLGIDPRKPNQQFRSMAQLPHGTGKKAIIAVFAQGEAAEKAKAAGASLVGAEDLLADIQAGNINFSRCIATPDMMPLVSRVARILGPRGLMPNPKMGTVTIDVETAVMNAMKGEVELRADKFGFVNLPLGKLFHK